MPEEIFYTICDSALGKLLVAATHKGICTIKFNDDENILRNELQQDFSHAKITEDQKHLSKWLTPLLAYLAGKQEWPLLPYDIKVSDFQRKVIEWLRTIPSGKTYSYSSAAQAMQIPKATRAFASACARNPIALISPCHRIVAKSGNLAGFRWGLDRKAQLLELEQNYKK